VRKDPPQRADENRLDPAGGEPGSYKQLDLPKEVGNGGQVNANIPEVREPHASASDMRQVTHA